MIKNSINQNLKNKIISQIDDFCVVTDRTQYYKQDQVFSIQPKKQLRYFIGYRGEEKC